ncbi:MAG: alpha/beta hydrolase family protein [Mobilitalea sp.]
MLGIIVLFVVLGVEVGIMICCLRAKSYQEDKKNLLRIALFLLFSLLMLIGVIQWSFRWNMLFLLLLIKSLIGIWYFVPKRKRKEKIYKKKHVIMSVVGNGFLITFAIFPAIMFPQFQPIETTGDYEVKTVSYTLTDPDRLEAFSEIKENRQVTIQFWYPENKNENEQYPLVVFSHGSFGFRGSNASTFENLASNGYVVCSIDHTYHAFFTKQTDDKIIIANMDFMNAATVIENNDYDKQTTYELTQEWLSLRVNDVNFVLEDILNKMEASNADQVYQIINSDKIGLFGHSLGGATAAELGRERSDIDAAIVVDGTMLGEEIGFENGEAVLDSTSYPIPLLNIYNETHYEDALQYGELYANTAATNHAIDARQVVVKGSGHLNFTDLPMFSPALASALGTGVVDSRYCIETTNQIILDYFNYYLKDAKELNLQLKY